MSPVLESTITVPSAVSALSLGPNDALCVGSYDGTVRWYDLPSGKVSRAVKALGDEISSVVWSHTKKDTPATVWIASGRKAICLPVDSPKMIMSIEDATAILEVGEDEEDVLNELSLSENGKQLAFGSDSGSIGVIELSSQKITRMRATHTTVCGCVKFVPDRPNELLSGGYDSALLHFDVAQGSTLSRFDITATPPSQGISLSPPFVLSISISTTGLLAASTADGRVWLGGGGEKRPHASQGAKKKRTRKWEGLKEDEGVWLQVADGPVVSIAFRDPGYLVACSLLGTISAYDISRDDEGELQATKVWSEATRSVEKVNAMTVSQLWVVIGGFGKDGKGVVETWRDQQRETCQPTT
ncbi:WD40 repeat-like protein [Trametes versicolor FP-101664 SS1]|uniref:WD40 repeat-like protein n=1 Tax=Trametes versicolor (strain FP-101664) TaxID=717944 RepID=UPI0004623C10|nr:WD40 repeat-like protein [Trametes versicolor FP-101664 SS1]EIW60133.1 WD40 repeat-like protein [Trametes versicolor FP-101664 SS1]